jgi:hypothetical protein
MCDYYEDGIFENIYMCCEKCYAYQAGDGELICHDCAEKMLTECPKCGEERCTFCISYGDEMCIHCQEEEEKEEEEREAREAEKAKEKSVAVLSNPPQTVDSTTTKPNSKEPIKNTPVKSGAVKSIGKFKATKTKDSGKSTTPSKKNVV